MKDTLRYVLIFSLFFTQYVTSAKTTINSNNEHELSTTKELDVAVNSSDCGIPKWYSDLEYLYVTSNPLVANTDKFVEYNGKIYKNNGYVGIGESNPSINSKWTLVTNSCSNLSSLPLADNCDLSRAWSSDTFNYNENDLVSFNGGLYRAKGWVSGMDVPDRYGQYDFVGICLNNPEISTFFNTEITIIQPDQLEEIDISAEIRSFGIELTEVKFQVKKVSEANFVSYNMTSTQNNPEDYIYAWLAAEYGVYNIKISAKNSVNQYVEVTGKIVLSRTAPTEIRFVSPENNTRHSQEILAPIAIVFFVDINNSPMETVEITEQGTNVSTPITINATGNYSWDWTPSAYGAHTIELKVTNTIGGIETERFQYLDIVVISSDCGIPKWYSDVSYLTPNPSSNIKYFVEYDGKIYENTAFVGTGESNPSINSKWTLVTDSCDNLSLLPLADNCEFARAWSSDTFNYNENDLVSFENGLYRAKSWVSGEDSPDRYAQYDFVGICVNKPEISTAFNKEVVLLQPNGLESIEIAANINSFGIDLSEVKFHIKSYSEANFTSFEMTSTNQEDYTYSWLATDYGVYNIKISAKNRANQYVEITGTIVLSKVTPPEIKIISPENNTQFSQKTLEPIEIVFSIDRKGSLMDTVEVFELGTGATTSLSIDAEGIYAWIWTPSAYATHTIEIKATNKIGDFQIERLQYKVENPAEESVSFEDSELYQISATFTSDKVFTFDKDITGLKMRDPSLANLSFAGNKLTVKSNRVGRSGLRLTTNDGVYYLGLRVDYADGRVAGLPDYVSIGSVSEDVPLDLDFWQDLDDDLMKNKRVDTRYIYVNGGADTGWPIDNPKRVENYVKNSLRYGLIPTFIYYQLPDKNESYYINDISIRDPKYMKKYFNNIELFLNEVQKFIKDELFVVVLEPDFLGYLQQRGEGPERETAVGLNDEIALGTGTLLNLVTRVNREFDDKRKNENLNLLYGWQLNLWAKPDVATSRGIVRETDNVSGVGGGDFETQLEKIRQTARDITQYGIDVGILSHNADFVSIDKYGLDAIAGATPDYTNPDPLTQPETFTWFWNNDHWINYLEFVKSMHELSNKHIVLWQVPIGHINKSQSISAYTNSRFTDLSNESQKYEDSATTFFFGDEFLAESDERYAYFSQNKHQDPKLTFDPLTKKITYGSHMEEVQNAGVRMILGGAGVGASTDGVGNPPTDDYFWIQKVQEYYQNDLVELIDTDNDGVNDFDDLCPQTPVGESVDENGCSETQKDDDIDGVNNTVDLCMFTLGGETVNLDGCSESQLDSDNDLITNDIDQCPNTAAGVEVDENGCDASLSVKTLEIDNVKIYPNPSMNDFTVNISVNVLKIYSTTGQLILSAKENTHKKPYDISHLEKGVYFIEIISITNKRTINKLIKL